MTTAPLIYVKICPSSIRCWDSNPQPSRHESPPIITRPGLPPFTILLWWVFYTLKASTLYYEKARQQCLACKSTLIIFPFEKCVGFIFSRSTSRQNVKPTMLTAAATKRMKKDCDGKKKFGKSGFLRPRSTTVYLPFYYTLHTILYWLINAQWLDRTYTSNVSDTVMNTYLVSLLEECKLQLSVFRL